jgi:F0F1-type ATP synthase membrane subunit c/vacuolar-type H+-ATPase subunit K
MKWVIYSAIVGIAIVFDGFIFWMATNSEEQNMRGGVMTFGMLLLATIFILGIIGALIVWKL